MSVAKGMIARGGRRDSHFGLDELRRGLVKYNWVRLSLSATASEKLQQHT